MKLAWWLDSFRILRVSLFRHFTGFKKYSGSVEEIARKIIEEAYNSKKNYFMVSSGHFRQFYARDFGMFCESLLNLGYKEKVRNTIIYAMQRYKSYGRITTHITTSGKPVDFPSDTPESAAYMLHSVIMLNNKKLIMKYKDFFRNEGERFYNDYVDKKTGLLRKDLRFSSMKDQALRESDCYNNCFLGMFANDLKKIRVKSSLHKYNYSLLIKKHFWTGSYFLEDLSGKKIITGDANTFPFWTELIDDKEMALKAINSVRKKKLDTPFPLKYTSKADVPEKFHWSDKIVPGYEKDTLWVHLALCYMKVVDKYYSKLSNKYVRQYESLIKKHKNFLELYFPNGEPFKRHLYVCDERMIWVAGFLELYLKKSS